MYGCNSNLLAPTLVVIIYMSNMSKLELPIFQKPIDFVHKFFIHIRKGLLYIAVIFLNEN